MWGETVVLRSGLPTGEQISWQCVLRCGREAVGSGWNMILRWIFCFSERETTTTAAARRSKGDVGALLEDDLICADRDFWGWGFNARNGTFDNPPAVRSDSCLWRRLFLGCADVNRLGFVVPIRRNGSTVCQ